VIARLATSARTTGRGLGPLARRDRSRSLSPHADRPGHPDDVRIAALGEALAKVGDLAVPRVGQDHVIRNPSLLRCSEHIERDLPLRLERDRLGGPRRLPAVSVIGPALRQVELHPSACASAFAREVKTHRHLAIVDAPECPGVLPAHASGMRTLLGETGVVDDTASMPGSSRSTFVASRFQISASDQFATVTACWRRCRIAWISSASSTSRATRPGSWRSGWVSEGAGTGRRRQNWPDRKTMPPPTAGANESCGTRRSSPPSCQTRRAFSAGSPENVIASACPSPSAE